MFETGFLRKCAVVGVLLSGAMSGVFEEPRYATLAVAWAIVFVGTCIEGCEKPWRKIRAKKKG